MLDGLRYIKTSGRDYLRLSKIYLEANKTYVFGFKTRSANSYIDSVAQFSGTEYGKINFYAGQGNDAFEVTFNTNDKSSTIPHIFFNNSNVIYLRDFYLYEVTEMEE